MDYFWKPNYYYADCIPIHLELIYLPDPAVIQYFHWVLHICPHAPILTDSSSIEYFLFTKWHLMCVYVRRLCSGEKEEIRAYTLGIKRHCT